MLIADTDPGGQILLWTLLLDRENQFGVVGSVSVCQSAQLNTAVVGFIQGAGGVWVMATLSHPSLPGHGWSSLALLRLSWDWYFRGRGT